MRCLQTAGHPAYKLLTLRTVPQIEQDAVRYTTFAWPALLKRLMQMFVTGTTCPDRLDWSATAGGADVAQGYRGAYNKSAGSVLVARGLLAPQVDVASVAAGQFYPSWQATPLLAAASAKPFRGYEMCCTMLSSDRVRSCAAASLCSALCMVAHKGDFKQEMSSSCQSETSLQECQFGQRAGVSETSQHRNPQSTGDAACAGVCASVRATRHAR